MGLTPLEGLPGATRSGHVDPSLIFHFISDASRMSSHAAEQNKVQISEAEDILNTRSGWAAVSGTVDFATIAERAGKEEYPKETLAFELFVDRVLHYLGAYLLKLGGPDAVDAVVFAGGIGERSAKLRKAVLERCKCVGFGLDEELNEKVNGEGEEVVSVVGKGHGEMWSLVCRTDEQVEMARECVLAKEFDQ
jgi:acetate kinase